MIRSAMNDTKCSEEKWNRIFGNKTLQAETKVDIPNDTQIGINDEEIEQAIPDMDQLQGKNDESALKSIQGITPIKV